MKPKVPETAEDFVLLLKRYANLLVALFLVSCPLYKCVKTVIDALKAFSKQAKDNLSERSKAAILWIILLQIRVFAMGDTTILVEFSLMQANLASKQGSIMHAELPTELLMQGTKKKLKHEREPLKEDGTIPKKLKGTNPNSWNPKLKAKLGQALYKARCLSFTQIMRFCGTDAEEVLPRDGATCTPNAFFGRCHKGDKCTKEHKQAKPLF